MAGSPEAPWDGVPGLVEAREAHGETTLVIEAARLADACLHLRDDEGFNFLSDLSAADYLGWGSAGVSGYIGTADGRDMHSPSTQGFGTLPVAKPARFSVSLHLLSLGENPRRLRVQTWLEDGESVASVVAVWPTVDFHEREAFDLLGIVFEGHPNLKRILLDDDWEGHPLRKDYPIGGEPVRFSEAQ